MALLEYSSDFTFALQPDVLAVVTVVWHWDETTIWNILDIFTTPHVVHNNGYRIYIQPGSVILESCWTFRDIPIVQYSFSILLLDSPVSSSILDPYWIINLIILIMGYQKFSIYLTRSLSALLTKNLLRDVFEIRITSPQWFLTAVSYFPAK